MEQNMLLLTPLLACITAYLAYRYGRSVLLWYMVGIISFPLSILLLLILGKTELKKQQDKQTQEAKKIFEKMFKGNFDNYKEKTNPFENVNEKNHYENEKENKDTIPCPYCRKPIDKNSRLCKFCKNPIN